MKKIYIIYSTIAILFGIFLFIYGGSDDSPGAQSLGLLIVIIGIIIIIKRRKNKLHK